MPIRISFFGLSALALSTVGAGGALAAEQTFNLDGFEAVSVSAGIEAIITVGGDYSVRAESTEEGLDRLEIELRGDELDIGRKNMRLSFGRQPKITVYVSMPALKALDASSGSHAKASGVEAGPFAVDASSGAHAEIAGVCDTLALDISSGAHVDAEALQCKSATADASSGAHATIFASDSITADASSGAHLVVVGGPDEVNIDKSTGGSISIRK
jgi:hypothetical protein